MKKLFLLLTFATISFQLSARLLEKEVIISCFPAIVQVQKSISVSKKNIDVPPVRITPKIYAMIIGVGDYNHMPVLNYTDDDAYRIYKHLRSAKGGSLPGERIRVLIDEDAKREKILRLGKELFSKAGPNDLVVLYFSGHGVKGAFLPSNYDGQGGNQLYYSEISQLLKSSRAKYKLVIADACYSGSLYTSHGASEQNRLKTLYSSQARAGTALIMSSRSEETSLESSVLRQGVFTYFLVKGLSGEADRNLDNIVTIKELFGFIQVNVRSYTKNRQTPIIRGNYDPNMTVAVTG